MSATALTEFMGKLKAQTPPGINAGALRFAIDNQKNTVVIIIDEMPEKAVFGPYYEMLTKTHGATYYNVGDAPYFEVPFKEIKEEFGTCQSCGKTNAVLVDGGPICGECSVKLQQTPQEAVEDIMSDTGKTLGVLKYNGSSAFFSPEPRHHFLASTEPFAGFLIEKVLKGMETKDKEQIRLGRLNHASAFQFSIKGTEGAIDNLIMRNVNEARIKELKTSIKWTFTKMLEKQATLPEAVADVKTSEPAKPSPQQPQQSPPVRQPSPLEDFLSTCCKKCAAHGVKCEGIEVLEDGYARRCLDIIKLNGQKHTQDTLEKLLAPIAKNAELAIQWKANQEKAPNAPHATITWQPGKTSTQKDCEKAFQKRNSINGAPINAWTELKEKIEQAKKDNKTTGFDGYFFFIGKEGDDLYIARLKTKKAT